MPLNTHSVSEPRGQTGTTLRSKNRGSERRLVQRPHPLQRRTNMWERLHQLLARLWRRSQEDSEEQQVEEARARFWSELREGESEAAERSRH